MIEVGGVAMVKLIHDEGKEGVSLWKETKIVLPVASICQVTLSIFIIFLISSSLSRTRQDHPIATTIQS